MDHEAVGIPSPGTRAELSLMKMLVDDEHGLIKCWLVLHTAYKMLEVLLEKACCV